jgi:hypothetical protein
MDDATEAALLGTNAGLGIVAPSTAADLFRFAIVPRGVVNNRGLWWQRHLLGQERKGRNVNVVEHLFRRKPCFSID